ncbi:AsmA family protein [uncultured Thiohalocapsa sp.]|uniref:AsmA family protein n=1 Tax=uncultured Thiohalocapsa sp. TaxID=768990 RepID=UPI0025DE6EA7|nr:AsmA family protein [uncultured Thiohalocapsa sp.]
MPVAAHLSVARGVSVLLVILMLVAPPLAPQDTDLPFGKRMVRDWVLDRLGDMAGRELSIEGDIDVDLGWTPKVRVGQVRVANAAWGRARHLLELEALEVRVDMQQLLGGRVRLPQLTLIRPTLFLEVSPAGEANWILGGSEQTIVESAAAPGGELGNLPQIDRLRVIGGDLRYLSHGGDADGGDGQWVEGHIDAAGGSLTGEGVDLAASGSLGGDAFNILLRSAALDELRGGDHPSPVFLSATAGSSRLRVEGTAVRLFALRGIDLELTAAGPGFHRLPLLTGLPESPPFELRGRLLGDAGDWRLEALQTTIGRSSLRGSAGFQRGGERPRITADLTAQTLALDELLSIAPEPTADAAAAAADRVTLPDGAIDLSVLTTLDADLAFTAERLIYERLRLQRVRAELHLDDGVLRLEPLSAAAGSGRISTRVKLGTEPLQASARVRLRDVALASLLHAGGSTDRGLGVLEGTLALRLPPRQSAGAGALVLQPAVALERLHVTRGRLGYREPARSTDVLLTLAAGPDQPGPRLHVQGRLRGMPLDGSVSADPLPRLLSQTDYGLEGRLEVGDSDLSGELVLDTAGVDPTVDADLSSATLDVAALSGLMPAAEGAGRTPAFHTDLNVRLDYTAGRILLDGSSITDLDIETRLADRRLRLGPLRLSWQMPAQDTLLELALDAPEDGHVRGRLKGRLRGHPVAATVGADAWLQLRDGGPPGNWWLRLTPADTRIELSGSLRDLLSPGTLDLDLRAEGDDTGPLSRLLGVSLPTLPPYALSAQVHRDGPQVVLRDLDASVGASDLSGKVTLDLAAEPPAVRAELRSDRLDYDDLTAFLSDPQPEPPGGLFPTAPLRLDRLAGAVQGRLDYRARRIIAAEVPLDALRLAARLRDGRLGLAPLRFGVGGGRVTLDLDMAIARRPPRAELSGEIARVDLRRVLNPFGLTDESLGIVGGRCQLWMRGDSIAELLGSADGGLFLLMTGGVLEQLLIELAGLDLGEAMLALVDEDRVPIDCAYLSLRSRGGQVTVENLSVDTRDTLFVGGGGLDLQAERLDVVIEARPKDASLPAFSSPLRLEGPLTDPRLDLVSGELLARGALAIGLAAAQPVAALLPLIEVGGDADSPYCNGLMQALEQAVEETRP